ncbi:LuxR family transcriptional regulator [Streptomyces flaveolus]|uniref:LuxR family transcriptional regulator n=1 Tax=Streptomyces flaveolus TaxID=67297 RepID=UPI0036FEE2C8
MALQRMDELRKAQLAISQLSDRYRGEGRLGETAETIEVVEGRSLIAQRFAQAQRAAQEEIRAFVTPPAVAVPATANEGQREALGAGVRYRVVYERASLDHEHPDTLLLDQWASLGEEMRVTVDLPLKMFIMDRNLALVIPRKTAAVHPTMLVTYTQPLLEALIWIFEKVWEAGVPVPRAIDAIGDGPLPAEDRQLLSLLLAGYTDRAINVSGAARSCRKILVLRRVERAREAGQVVIEWADNGLVGELQRPGPG